MKIRKTRQDKRETYRFEFYTENENGGCAKECIELRPGENGVNEYWIKTLHSMDDHEVYLNCKNGHPPMTEAEKAAKERAEALEISRQLREMTLVVSAKGGGAGRLFGSVTNQEIADALKAKSGISACPT